MVQSTDNILKILDYYKKEYKITFSIKKFGVINDKNLGLKNIKGLFIFW